MSFTFPGRLSSPPVSRPLSRSLRPPFTPGSFIAARHRSRVPGKLPFHLPPAPRPPLSNRQRVILARVENPLGSYVREKVRFISVRCRPRPRRRRRRRRRLRRRRSRS
jgi:hypothetical protein